MRVSTRLKLALLQRRAEGTRQYQIARMAGIHPTVLSAIMNDAVPMRENDPRVLRLADALDLPVGECFERQDVA